MIVTSDLKGLLWECWVTYLGNPWACENGILTHVFKMRSWVVGPCHFVLWLVRAMFEKNHPKVE